jgi:chromosome segregation ATPase
MSKRVAKGLADGGGDPKRTKTEHDLEPVMAVKYEALRAAFKQKREEVFASQVACAQATAKAAQAEAAVSAMDRQVDAFLLDLETFNQQLGDSSANAERTSMLDEVLTAGTNHVEADTTKFTTKVERISRLLGLGNTADEDDEEEDERDTGLEAARQIEVNSIVSARVISERVEAGVRVKLDALRSKFKTVLHAVEGKSVIATISRDKMLSEAQAEAKRLATRMHALEDQVTKSNVSLKMVTAQLEAEKDANDRLMWRVERYRNGGSVPGVVPSAAAEKISGGDAASSSSAGTKAGSGEGLAKEAGHEVQLQLRQAQNELALTKTDLEHWKRVAEDRGKENKEKANDCVKLANVIRKYHAEPPPRAVLELSTDYVQAVATAKTAQGQIDAAKEREKNMSKNYDAVMEQLMEYKKACSVQINSLREEWQSQVNRERDSAQKYSKYADELKVKLHEEQLKSKSAKDLENRLHDALQTLETQRAGSKRLDNLTALVNSSDKDQETKALYNDLSEVEAAYEQQETLNTKLMGTLAAKDAEIQKLHKQRRSAEQAQKLELQKGELQAHQNANLLKHKAAMEGRLVELERRVKALDHANIEWEKKHRAAVESAATPGASGAGVGSEDSNSTTGHEKKIQELLSELGDMGKTLADQDAQKKRDQEKLNKLESKNASLKSENKRLAKGAAPVSDMEQQLTTVLQGMHCSLNQHLWKDCLIAKCGHAFARESIEAQLAKRNRNCPKCGLKFDRADLINFNIKAELMEGQD